MQWLLQEDVAAVDDGTDGDVVVDAFDQLQLQKKFVGLVSVDWSY